VRAEAALEGDCEAEPAGLRFDGEFAKILPGDPFLGGGKLKDLPVEGDDSARLGGDAVLSLGFHGAAQYTVRRRRAGSRPCFRSFAGMPPFVSSSS